MEQELVGLLVGRLAVVAGDRHRHVFGEDLAAQLLEPMDDCSAMTTALVPGRLAMASDTAGTRSRPSVGLAHLGDAGLLRLGGERHRGDVAHIDRPAVAGGEQDVADLGERLQRLAGDDRPALAARRGRVPAWNERLAPVILPASCCSVMP